MDVPITPSFAHTVVQPSDLANRWLIKEDDTNFIDVGCHFTLELKAYDDKMMSLLDSGDITLGSVYQGLYNLIKDKNCPGLELDCDANHDNKLHILATSFLCVLRKYENKVIFYNVRTKDQ